MSSTRKRLEALTANLLPQPAPATPASVVGITANEPPKGHPSFPPMASAPVETRFPPAAGAGAPKTGPGQMMAFRGQIQLAEGEMAALREKLTQYEDSLPTKRLDPRTVRASRWANRHEDSFKTSEFAGLKADMEQAGGNVQAILVRPLKGDSGQFEIIFGHRRHRAALELGMPVLASIWIDDLGDAALFAAMDRENRERADLSSYEQGVMYHRALDEQLFPTQRQLAEALGVSHTWVRKALLVAQLPSAVLECFRTPLEVSFRHAELINAAMEKDRKGVLKRAEKIRERNLTPSLVVATLTDAKPSFERSEKLTIQVAGSRVGQVSRTKGGEISILLLPNIEATITDESLETAILEMLRKVRRL